MTFSMDLIGNGILEVGIIVANSSSVFRLHSFDLELLYLTTPFWPECGQANSHIHFLTLPVPKLVRPLGYLLLKYFSSFSCLLLPTAAQKESCKREQQQHDSVGDLASFTKSFESVTC